MNTTQIGTKATTVRLENATLERLDGMARATGRSRSYLIKDAVDRYLDYEEWFAEQVGKGLDDVRHGRIASPEAVQDTFARFGVDVDKPTD